MYKKILLNVAGLLILLSFTGCNLVDSESQVRSNDQAKLKSLDDLSKQYHIHEKERIASILEMEDPSKEIHVIVPNVPIDQNNLLDQGQRGTCPYCCSEPTVSVCAAEATLEGVGTHWFFGTCTVHYFISRGAEMCPFCGKIIAHYGYHDCWEIHSDCFKGWYDVCPMDVT